MATLKEFEEALRQNGMTNALAILETLKVRDRARRSIAPARRVVGKKMTADLARSILDLHASTGMTQQEIAFKLGVNQGRVNEVIKRGKWLSGDPSAAEAQSRDKAMQRLDTRARARRAEVVVTAPPPVSGPSPTVVVTAAPEQPVQPAAIRSVAPARETVAKGDVVQSAPVATKTVRRPSPVAHRETRSARETPVPKPRIISAQLAFLDL